MRAIGTPVGALLTVALAAILTAAALAIAGLQTVSVRTFALRVPDSQPPVAVVGPHRQACEGPVESDGRFDSVGIFGMYRSGAPLVTVEVRSTRGRKLASGSPPILGHHVEHRVDLDRPVGGATPVDVCVSALYGRFSLLGSAVGAIGMHARGVSSGTHFSLILERRSTLLASLGTTFRRAAAFRPDWVGAWTFWALLCLLIATLGLVGLAVYSATRDDGDADPPRTP